MAQAFPRLTAGDTRQFTATYSTQPSTPTLTLWAGSGPGTVVATYGGQASSTLAYYAFVTLPLSVGFYRYEWVASYTAGPVRLPGGNQGLFKIIGVTPG